MDLELLAHAAQTLIDLVLTGTDVVDQADDEPQRPDQEQAGDDGSEDSESKHFFSFVGKEKRGAILHRSPFQGMG